MTDIKIHPTRSIANHFFWVLSLQAVMPCQRNVAAMRGTMTGGYASTRRAMSTASTALFLAWRVRKFWREAPEIFS